MPKGALHPTMAATAPDEDLLDGTQTTEQMAFSADTELSWESGEITAKEVASRAWIKPLALAVLAVVVVGGAVGVFFGVFLSGSGGSGHLDETLDTAALIASDPVVPDAKAIPLPVNPPPQQAEVVRIDLDGLPEGARVFLNDLRVEELPLRIERGEETRQLRVEADGYVPFEVEIDATRDLSIEVRLEPETQPEGAQKTKRPWRGKIRRPPRENGKQPSKTYTGPDYID